jgi:hypothetical protein
MLSTAPVIWVVGCQREKALLPWNLDLPAERDQERTGMPSFRNVATPFRVSIKATFCGVETMTEPVTKRNFTSVIFARARNLFRVQQRDSQGASPSTSTSCPRLSVTSPVPGGVSMTSTSRSCPDVPARQSTSNNSCCTASRAKPLEYLRDPMPGWTDRVRYSGGGIPSTCRANRALAAE